MHTLLAPEFDLDALQVFCNFHFWNCLSWEEGHSLSSLEVKEDESQKEILCALVTRIAQP